MDIGKLVADIDAVATQHGLTERHDLDALAGVAVSAWRISKSHEAAIDAARTEARRLAHDIAAKQAIDQMIAAVRSHGSPLATIQAGL